MSTTSKHALAVTALLCQALGFAACGNGNNENVLTIDLGGGESDMTADAGDTGASDADATITTTMCGEPTGMRPPPLSEHAGAFVPGANGTGGTLVIFGGSLGVPMNCAIPQRTYETTTWLYDVDCDSWTKLEGSTPQGRARHTAVYDASGNQVIIHAGLGSGGPLSDTWALDMDTKQWSQLTTTGNAPTRFNHTAGYDPEGRLLVFGGNLGSSVINIQPGADVWALDLATMAWADVTPAGAGPAPRLWVAGTWDPDQSQFAIFGGGDDSAFTGVVDYFEDLWAWTDASGTPTWTQLDAGSNLQPDGRFWAGLTYDSVNQRYVMFGGHDDTNLGNRNDTWFFDTASGQWSQHLVGDRANKPPNGACDFPADFTIVEDVSPERRNAEVFVSGPTGAYSMGGKTDCGIVDDLVRFNFADDAWEVLTRATIGEVCLRKGGGDSCSSLCL